MPGSRMGKRLFVCSLLLMGFAASLAAQARRPAHRSGPARITITEISSRKTLGVPTAPIKIEEFTDFECPACRALYTKTLRPLISQYVTTGKVYLVHHDFPLPMHRYSRKAAYYANAAAAIGQFEPVERALFTHQPQWQANGKIAPILAKVLKPAELKRVEELARKPQIQEAVARDVRLAEQLRVRQTPTMYITHNGNRTGPVVGVVKYSILRHYLEVLLRQKRTR